LVAGRLAADLDREVLLKSETQSRGILRQLEGASRMQLEQLPKIAPLVEGWQIAGWTSQGSAVGGALHDWWMHDDGRLFVAAAQGLDGGIEGALCAASLRATVRGLAQGPIMPNAVLEQASQALWSASAGDQFASLFCAAIEPNEGRCDFAAAGQMGAILIGRLGNERLIAPSLSLGVEPSAKYLPREFKIEPSQLMIVVNDGVHEARDGEGRPWTMSGVADAVQGHLDASAETIAELIRDRLEAYTFDRKAADRTVLVVKRELANARSPL
jgi:serine phosphatase RsbU (regulator of sigma subunit)